MENLPEVSRATVAWALGYISMGFWLFAQAPQVVKNARLRSCEGLALPFLCNWLFGDITNFVGCILTDQLPFQTYLAAYFCIIDFTLLVQFFYYRPTTVARPPIYRSSSNYTSSPQQSLLIQTAPLPPIHHSRTGSRSQLAPHARARSSSAVPHNALAPLSASTTSTVRPGVGRSAHTIAHPGEASTSTHSSIYRGRETSAPGNSHHLVRQDGSYQAIYEAALDVARAAERAEYHRQNSQSRSRTRIASRRHRVSSNQPSMTATAPEAAEDMRSPPTLGNRSAMFDSFHSDMSALTDSSATSSGPVQDGPGTMSMSTPALLDRGRSLQRTATVTPAGEEEGGDVISGLPGEGGRGVVQMRETRSRSKSRGVSMARATSGRGSGRRAAGVAFMSLGMVAGWNGIGRGAKIRQSQGSGGTVLLRPDSSATGFSRPVLHPLTILPSTLPLSRPSFSHIRDTTYVLVDNPSIYDHPLPPIDEPPDFKRIVGRISAWACTTLYLTSRLPQIWKNFERKSVEGLSILLFLFAFCGNTAYVASIVYNPAASLDSPESTQYLLEALPYLLGSGGTLLFDLTIIFQSLLYGSAPPVPQTTIERSSFRKPLFRRRLRLAEEGRGVSASAHGPSFGERQPLLSGSMVTVNGGSRRHRPQQQQQQGLGPQSVPMGEGESRTRSVSADVQLGEGGTWREGGGGIIAGLRRVEVPVDEHSSGDD